jgi:hypothetical protein
MEQLRSHWADFHEILCVKIFINSVKKIQFLLNSHKDNGALNEGQYTF